MKHDVFLYINFSQISHYSTVFAFCSMIMNLCQSVTNPFWKRKEHKTNQWKDLFQKEGDSVNIYQYHSEEHCHLYPNIPINLKPHGINAIPTLQHERQSFKAHSTMQPNYLEAIHKSKIWLWDDGVVVYPSCPTQVRSLSLSPSCTPRDMSASRDDLQK